jgi:membrane-bound lytic murein transglycosylase B
VDVCLSAALECRADFFVGVGGGSSMDTAKGANLEGAALQHTGPLALVELQNGDAAPSFVAGTSNFYAVTRYNWSSYYAMAVIELGQAVRRAYQGAP